MVRIFRLLLPLIILGASGTGAYWMVMTAPKATPKAFQEKIWPLSVTTGEIISLTPRIEVFGEITAGSSVTLRPLVSGRVVAVGPRLKEGAVVEKGELLAQIDRFEYEAILAERKAEQSEARAILAETKANLAGQKDQIKNTKKQIILRRRDFQRRVDLRQKGSGTEKSVDDAQLLLNEAKLSLAQKLQEVARLEARVTQQLARLDRVAVSLSRAERNISDTTLVAPFRGFLLNTEAAVGRIMSTSDTVARIIDAGSLEAKFELSDSDYGRLFNDTGGLVGRSAVVHWTIGKKQLSFDARIRRKGAEIDPATGGIKFYAHLTSGDIVNPIRPGAFVRIEIPDKHYKDVLKLPAAALENNKYIYIVKNERLVRIPVTVLRRLDGNVLVQSADINQNLNGIDIVSRRFPEIGPGLRVKIR